jgi:rhodanese-related sulfurtransferase
MRDLTPVELRKHLDSCNTEPLVLDVREKWEYEICHLPGSVLVPMGQITTVAHTFEPDRETVVICHHGIRSRSVCAYLEEVGLTQVINLAGGIAAWSQEVDPTVATY